MTPRGRWYAHSDGSTETSGWYRFADHAEGVADGGAAFLGRFGLHRLARAWGLLHDVGKVTPEFQDILAGSAPRFDHSAPGARIAIDRYRGIGKILAPGIAGHHAGMANWSGEGERTPYARDGVLLWLDRFHGTREGELHRPADLTGRHGQRVSPPVEGIVD